MIFAFFSWYLVLYISSTTMDHITPPFFDALSGDFTNLIRSPSPQKTNTSQQSPPPKKPKPAEQNSHTQPRTSYYTTLVLAQNAMIYH